MEVEIEGKSKRHQKKVTRYVTIAAVIGVVLVAAIALMVYFLVPPVTIAEFPTDGSPLEYFKFDRQDAIQVTWSHGANSKAQLAKALASDVHMLEADILLRGQGTHAQTDIPVMAHPPQTDSDNTFQEWLDAALESSKGLKLDFKSIGSVAPSLRILRNKSNLINRPVWLNADILRGPNTVNPGVNAREFIDTVNRIFPECTLSIGWTTGFYYDRENEGYTRQMVEEMHSYCGDLTQPVTFPIRNSLLSLPGTLENLEWLLSQSDRSGKSNIIGADVILGNQNQPIMAKPTDNGYDLTFEEWLSAIMAADHDVAVKLTFHTTEAVIPQSFNNESYLKWLLEQSDTYTLTLSEGQTSIDPVDLLKIRNDFDWSRVFYDITTEKATELLRMTETGGSLVNFFQASYKIYGRDGLSITWADGVNSREAIEEAMGAYREVTMLEADVDIRSDNVPIMSDDASVAGSDVITLEEWLDVAKMRQQGIMLEFHSVGSVVPALEVFQRRSEDLRSPVMLKAKIPGLFSKETFIDPIVNMFPHVSIVFAMRPVSPLEGYSRAQVEQISRMCANLTQVVTFSVDVRQVRGSWDNLSWLLNQSALYNLYIWAGWPEQETYSVDVTDLVFVRNNFDHTRVFYDLIPRVMKEFKKAIEET
ncbi:protein FAM151A-like [Branchiostoma floridae]|uniref:Protein FAM151A-like n=1 Tax=Branchiostoma floridae TaxID=7739 RepID=A0A9J7KIK6_BRAFL|nr:protein FAM151A-like [Branchiostoma floridae]